MFSHRRHFALVPNPTAFPGYGGPGKSLASVRNEGIWVRSGCSSDAYLWEFEKSGEPRSPSYATLKLPHPERSLALKEEKALCQGPMAEGVSPLTGDHTGMAQGPPGLPRAHNISTALTLRFRLERSWGGEGVVGREGREL